jgi:precorrin-2 methylase
MDERSPVRVSITASLVVSIVAGVFSWGVTWATTRAEIVVLRRDVDRLAAIAEKQAETDARLSSTDAVVASQYGEIIRRLGTIEQAVGVTLFDRPRR